MDVVVTGIGLLSALGTLTSSWQSLLKGRSGIGLHQPFPELPPYPLGLINSQPIELTNLTKLVVAAALEDAKLAIPLPECGVVIGSSRGAQAHWEQLATIQNNSNFLFPLPNFPPWLETLPHQGAIATARYLGTTAPVLAPMAACATGIWAIARGFELIQTGECQRVIVGALEAPITRLTLAGFERMGALAKTGCYPFDKRREGLVLGEGGAVFVLETAELALSRGADIYGQILGFGLTCDAHHPNAPESSNKSALIALKQCLERSHLYPSDIDYIHAHGTATKLNDFHEAQLINYLFRENTASPVRERGLQGAEPSSAHSPSASSRTRGTQKVAVSSTKGATGHPLGASGAMGVGFSLMALKEQKLPPCIGLKESEFDLDLVTFSRESFIEKALCLSFGFGGQNSAIALAKF